jgi:hypothetical protein
VALLGGEAWVDSNGLMTSICSFVRQNIEKGTPTRVVNAFSKIVVLYHPSNVEIFNADKMIVICVLPCCLEVEVTALPFNLKVCLSSILGSLASAMAPLLASDQDPLLPSQGALTLAVMTRILEFCWRIQK